MDFTLTSEQGMLQDTLRKYLAREYTFEARRARVASPEGLSRETWAQLAELGVLGIAVPEDDGGLGGDAFDTMVVMEALGPALVVEPYLSTVVLGAGTIAAAGTPEQKEKWLPALVGGEKMMAFAHGEPHSRFETAHVQASAKRSGSGWTLTGTKAVVRDAPSADLLLVSTRTAGGARDAKGISLFLVDAKAKGVSMRSYATQDGGRAADITFDGVALDASALLGAPDEALPVLEHALDRANAALCAESLGLIDALNDATLTYLKTREQFRQAIGRFQALQHRMVDMTMRAVEARSMAIVAAAGANTADASERRRMVSAARALIGQGARYVGQQAVQLHGGIGVTDELVVSHWFKRLSMINTSFGDADHHLAIVSDLLLEGAPG